MRSILPRKNGGNSDYNRLINSQPPSSSASRILSLPNPSLPYDECTVLSPSLIWNNQLSFFQLDDLELTDRLSVIENQGLLDVLFGLPRRNTGMSMLNFRNVPVVNAFSTTVVLRDFQPE